MPIAAPAAGDRILNTDLGAFYNLLKGVAGSGEAITLVYNAAGVIAFIPSSDPAATTQLFQIKNAASTVKSALTAGGGAVFSSVINAAKSADIASSGTTDLSTATGNYAVITGTTTITAFGTVQAGTMMVLEFSGILTLTHNATSLILRAGANATTAAGDVYFFMSEGSGNWREVAHLTPSAAVSLTTGSNDVSGDVTMTNANQFYDGPSLSLAAGTWYVVGTVTINDGTSTGGNTTIKLWDGTTVVASAAQTMNVGGVQCLTVAAVITIGSTTTYKVSAASTQAGHSLKAAAPNNGAGNNASHLRAVKAA